jgi:hypothetical protein
MMRPETVARIVAVFRDAGVVIEAADGRTGVWMASSGKRKTRPTEQAPESVP